MTLLESMARQEGFYSAGTRASRNNNPGNLEYGRFTRAHGAVGTDGRFAIFATADAGFAAMRALLTSAYWDHSVADMLAHYAPANENDTQAYLKNICDWARVQPSDLVGKVIA